MGLADLQVDRRWQYAVYVALSLVALIFIVILLPSSGAYFCRFFGKTNAILVIVVASVVGAVALWILQSSYKEGFSLHPPRGLCLSLGCWKQSGEQCYEQKGLTKSENGQ